MALRQNPFHLATQEQIGQAQAQVRQATAGFLPTLNAQATDTLDEKLFVLEFPSMIPGQPPSGSPSTSPRITRWPWPSPCPSSPAGG